MSRKNLVIIIVFALLSLLYCFWPLIVSACAAAEVNQETMTIPRQQWTELKSQLEQQQVMLLTLQEEITMLEKPSGELMQNLKEARQQLKTAQNELTASNSSLKSASMEIEKLSTLCSELKQQIQQEKKKASLKAKQNAFWGFMTGLLIGIAYNNL